MLCHDVRLCHKLACGSCCYMWERLRIRLYAAALRHPYTKNMAIQQRWHNWMCRISKY